MVFEAISGILQRTSENFWGSFVSIFPGIIAAIIILIIGWILGVIVGGVISRIIRETRLDHWMEKRNLANALYGMKLSYLLGTLAKWYIIFIFLSEAVNLIQLEALSVVMSSVVLFLPRVIGAALVIMAGLLIGEYLKDSIRTTKFEYRNAIGTAVKALVVYFALVIGLQTAGFEVAILLDAFRIGFAAMVITIALAAGISFGLALKDDAKRIIRDLRPPRKRRRRR